MILVKTVLLDNFNTCWYYTRYFEILLWWKINKIIYITYIILYYK